MLFFAAHESSYGPNPAALPSRSARLLLEGKRTSRLLGIRHFTTPIPCSAAILARIERMLIARTDRSSVGPIRPISPQGGAGGAAACSVSSGEGANRIADSDRISFAMTAERFVN